MSQEVTKLTPQFTPLGILPTQEQLAIQCATAKLLLIEANAGAAKTTTLALRIGESLVRGCQPEEILVLVFTDTARDVMRRRLIELGVHFEVVQRIALHTFESFARQELAKFDHDKVLRYSNLRQQTSTLLEAVDATYANYSEQLDDLNLSKTGLALTQYWDTQLRLKAQMAIPDEIDFEELDYVFEKYDVAPTHYLVAYEYERIRRGVWGELKFRGAFDATYDLARDIGLGSERSSRLGNYRLVVCDELHDLNEAAFQIVCDLISKPQCFFIGAGDRDQVIHATLGASHEYLRNRFKMRFPYTATLPLTITHRHGPHLAVTMGAFKNKLVQSSVADKFELQVKTYDDTWDSGAQQVVAVLNAWKKAKRDWSRCAVLIRDRHQAIAIENALHHAKIGYFAPKMGSYLQREEILFLRGLLAMALENFAQVTRKEVKEAIVEAIDLYADLKIPFEELIELKKGMASHSQLHWFYDRYLSNQTDKKRRELGDIVRWIKSQAPSCRADDVLTQLCERLQLKKMAQALYVRPYDAQVVIQSIEGFIHIAGTKTLAEFCDAINEAERFTLKYRDKEVLTLDCIANVKGKEFDHVLIPFLELGEFPSPLAELIDEENLFYVGATRAKTNLTLFTPQAPERQSSFLARMKINDSKLKNEARHAQERNENATQTQEPSRVYLNVPFADKDEAKALGARWDGVRKKWFVPIGLEVAAFAKWM